jgi:hypothetical protein
VSTQNPPLWPDRPHESGPDIELAQVVGRLKQLDPDGSRFGRVLRDTLDQLLDGQRTGRYAETELRKTEKTHMGTLVEINLHRAFDFADGSATDYRIDGIEVDCKFSRSFGGWEIPLEAYGHLCLVIWADDQQSRWSAGVVRIRDELLMSSQNRDRKRRLNPDGIARIAWLHKDAELPENLLLHLPERDRDRIFSHRAGQARVNELFRIVQRRIVSRTAVLTVAQQKDAPKRVRDARRHLRREGTIILGHQGDHPRIAQTLRLPKPAKGEWVSIRVVRASPSASDAIKIAGQVYRRAEADDAPEPAPLLDSRVAEADE